MSKPVCLITGATDGVGKATATALARKGFKVVIAARNPGKASAAKDEIEAVVGVSDVEVLIADLASLAQVQQLADRFKTQHPRLDVLINNAGVMLSRRQVTEDGLEATWQINYLSAFLLTHLLTDALKVSGQGRIVNLSSSVYSIGKIAPNQGSGQSGYSAIGAYAASKLAMLLFSLELAERLRETRVTANAVHPGVVRTQMLGTAEGLFKLIALLATPFAVSPEKGASASVMLASSPDVARMTGLYWANGKPQLVKSRFNTPEARGGVWWRSVEQLRERGFPA
jgi:retinol dehydrogenase-12